MAGQLLNRSHSDHCPTTKILCYHFIPTMGHPFECRDHINDPDDDNDGIPDLEDDDDDGDGVTDREVLAKV